ncbi:hypothetical protein CKO40_11870 [Halochromatium glycolicum]|uniref:Uncharacterized protein n=1 Tax=Halochromatium glycolicum TaxID=85075 RepID=A0AAJ0U5M1_9GAMM|nr:hypothetical protein [Halochromatium glycolicum]
MHRVRNAETLFLPFGLSPRIGDRPVRLAGLLALDLVRLDFTVGTTQAKLDSLALFSNWLQFYPNGIVGQQPDELTDGPPQLVAVAGLVRVAAWEWHRVRSNYREERDKSAVADEDKARCRYPPIPCV